MEGVGEYEYCTKDLIGHGAFAVVFKGRHKKNHNSVVAIKSITKKNLSKSQNLLGKEIKILKELTELHHENVVALLDCKETPHHVYLVMEYCNGGDLADYLHAKGTLSEDTIRLFLRQLAGAMRALNAKGIVHRDLKPQNILLCHSGKQNPAPHEIRLKIADFGFARFLQEGVMAATLCGSPMYMAPEVIMSLQYDAKADLWSIGTIVFQCLTGKAPFQAQTPQALKQFYEKNVNLAPKIPAGTSPDLADLLLKLLKRNAKDRVEFDEFFVHPFLKKIIKSTSPVPVPSRQRSLPPECSPPLSRALPDLQVASPRIVPLSSVDVDEEMPQECPASSPSLSDHSRFSPVSKGSPGSNDEQEDFVLVPVNLPSDGSPEGAMVQTNKRKSADICSTSPASVRHQATRMISASPRPAYLPVANSPGSATGCSPPSPLYAPSEPIPVPSQKEAFQMIQQSLRDSDGSGSRDRDRHNSSPSPSANSPRSPKVMQNAQTAMPARSDSSESGACWGNISSLSPPAGHLHELQFGMGTPPSVGGRRIGSSGGSVGTPPSPWGLGRMSPPPVLIGRHTPTGSPLRKSSMGNTNYFFHQSPLSPILASPCKPNTVGLNYNTLFAQLPPSSDAATSPSQPLIVPFGNRAHTLPDISGNDFQTGGVGGNAAGSEALFRRSGSVGKIGEKMKVAFASPNPLGTCHGHPHFQFGSSSPPGSEGLVLFVAPELPEETLMEREHNETLAKLNFVSALVDCIVELARSRSTPLAAIAESTQSDVNVASEGRRRAEQLVLYVRALQLLSSSLNLARDELKAVRLQPSNSVRNVVGSMNERYHLCLRMCKVLHGQNLLQAVGVDPAASEITADRLIYNYAIEMCQSAALDELFGNPQECFRRYQTAQILLHSLAQQVGNDQDRQLLNKYKEAVEKRLYVLQQQGYIYAYDTT